MTKIHNVKSEFELYEPMRAWLQVYLEDRYKSHRITTIDAHASSLDSVLSAYNVDPGLAIGLGIQIDVLGIAQRAHSSKLFFIEAKKTSLTIRDLGQLWAYCKLIEPQEAFLFSSLSLGTLDRLLNGFHRFDLLNFGSGKSIKQMRVARWNIDLREPDFLSMVPRNV